MVISANPQPNIVVFEDLLKNTVTSLKEHAKNNESDILKYTGSKLEKLVFETMKDRANGTEFDGSIELISGQRFPDIIAKKYYGVEVKTSQKEQWTSIGSSIAEGTRIDGIERIFLLFGKMLSPVNFMCKPYESCLSDIVVTHSPRYRIDMNLNCGETIFDKMNISYDTLRNDEDPIGRVQSYYRSKLKTDENVWWLGSSSSVIIKAWSQLTPTEKNSYRNMGFCLFPEILTNSSAKFNRFAIWLSTTESIVCPNVRDIFTAGGQKDITIGRNTFRVSQILGTLLEEKENILRTLDFIDLNTLSLFLDPAVNNQNKRSIWKKQISSILKSQNIDDRIIKYLNAH